MTVRVSVVVPTYRRPALLARCLRALLAQEFNPAAYEIIVADDAACTETRAMVERCAETAAPRLRYLPVDHGRGPAAARNAGWRAAGGEIIAFTDDDCVPQRNWLRAGTAYFVNGEVGVGGRVEVPLPPAPTDAALNASYLSGCRFVTANCFYQRAALAAVGGFDERFQTAWREDSDLYFRLVDRHPRADHFVEAADAVVVHPPRPAPWGSSLGDQRKSMFNALLYKKHPRRYRETIQPGPPWHYYRIVGALLLAGLSLLTGRRRTALGLGLLWAGLTARFCAHRLRRTSRAPRHVAEMVVTSILIPPLSIYWRLRGAVRYRVWFL